MQSMVRFSSAKHKARVSRFSLNYSFPPAWFYLLTSSETSAVTFGSEDRYDFKSTSHPFSTVGLVSKSPSGSCTGTMVGPRHVLTATHCLTSDMTFTPGYNDGDAPFGTARVSTYWKFSAWERRSNDELYDDEVAFDYAVLILDQRMGDYTGWMGVKDFSESWKGGEYWDNIGYPDDIARNSRPVYSTGGSIWSVETYTRRALNGKMYTGKVLGSFIDAGKVMSEVRQ